MTAGFTVAMADPLNRDLREHLLRADGQEDLCIAIYRTSTAAHEVNVVLVKMVPPDVRDREVHGTVTFTGRYVLRAAALAAELGGGVAILHSHPLGQHWQLMSDPDHDAERSFAVLATEVTGLPLVGMTLAGDGTWSARRWAADTYEDAGAVRVSGLELAMSFNDALRPAPPPTGTQARTVSAWGRRKHADIARIRVLIVGAGSVGLDVVLRLAATGIKTIGIMDFDRVEWINLDRLVGATALDALLGIPKVTVAARLAKAAATALGFTVHEHQISVCDPAGLQIALDYDVIFSCVDRPWPRAILNTIAYTDMIPVIDGGIAIDSFDEADGGGMRSATWRSHVLVPGRPCMACNGQLDPSTVPLDRDGLLDDAEYIAKSGITVPGRQNVAALSASVSAALLSQFVSLVAAPGGFGAPQPQRYLLATHTQDDVPNATRAGCGFEGSMATGDARPDASRHHWCKNRATPPSSGRLLEVVALVGRTLLGWCDRTARRRLDRTVDG
jgi:hypothetical protein